MQNPTRISWLPLLRLIRLPNAFSVVSNVLVAQLVFGGAWDWRLALLLPASLAFYFFGMVQNDLCDLQHDREFRPDRPLPSGAVSRTVAVRLAALLSLAGLGLAIIAGVLLHSGWTPVLAVAVWSFINLYNLHAKHHAYGGLVMAGCRMLNVYFVAGHLVASAPALVQFDWASPHWYPIGLALYVGGVTHFARHEETESRRSSLIYSALIIVIGSAALFVAGTEASFGRGQPGLVMAALYLLLLLPTIRGCGRAIITPVPAAVQHAVGTALRSLVILDAFVCFAVMPGTRWMAVFIALLLIPNYLLGRWIRAT